MLQIHLDLAAILAAGGTIKTEWRGSVKEGRNREVLHFNGRRMDIPDDRTMNLYPGNLFKEIDPVFEPFVAEVSYFDNFGDNLHPTRRLGEYRLASAKGELSVVGGCKEPHYHLRLRARKMKDLRELYSLIRQGQIWPAKDYEAEQVPPPFYHLRDLVTEVWQLIRRDVKDRLYRISDRINEWGVQLGQHQ